MRYEINERPHYLAAHMAQYKNIKVKDYTLIFDNYAEFITACDNSKAKIPDNAGFKSNSWAGTTTYPEAYKLATEGWKAGAANLQLQLDKIDVSSHIKKPEIYFDVYGDYGFDMARVMSGEPENMITSRETNELSDNGPIVKIVVNTVLSASIPLDVVMRRGAAIVSVIDALENAGRQVELVMVCAAWVHNAFYTHIVPMKNASEALQVDQIAFSIGHPSIERRFNFVALNLFPTWILDYSYGSPTDITQAEINKCDIYFPQMHGLEKEWSSIANVTEWIKNKIHSLGIKFEGEA